MSCGQELSWVPQGLQRVLVAGAGDCQRHLLAVGICQWLWLCPVLAVSSSSEVSHLELVTLRGSDCSPAHSSAVLAVLPPHLKSSNWLFGSLYTKFKLLALTLNLHIISPPCSSHCLLLFFLLGPSLLPFSLSLAPVSSYTSSQLQVSPFNDFLPFKPSLLHMSLYNLCSFPKLLPSTFSTQDCKLFNAGCFPTSFTKSCWEFPYICNSTKSDPTVTSCLLRG